MHGYSSFEEMRKDSDIEFIEPNPDTMTERDMNSYAFTP